MKKLTKKEQHYIDEDKIRKSNIEFGVVTAELPSLKGHCVFANDIPKGEISDFIMASAACFPFVQPHEIGDKKFVDGGFFDNLPVDMAAKKGARHVIAVDLDPSCSFFKLSNLFLFTL